MAQKMTTQQVNTGWQICQRKQSQKDYHKKYIS